MGSGYVWYLFVCLLTNKVKVVIYVFIVIKHHNRSLQYKYVNTHRCALQ